MQANNQMIPLRIGLFTNQPILLESWKLLMKSCCGVGVVVAASQMNDLVINASMLDCLLTSFQDFQCLVPGLPLSIFRTDCPRIVCLSCPGSITIPEGWRVTRLSENSSVSELFHACGIHAHEKTLFSSLSPRELSVVMAYTKGQSLKEISGALQIGVTAVQSYRNRAMQKLGVASHTDLAVLAAAHGLRDCPCRAQNEIEYHV